MADSTRAPYSFAVKDIDAGRAWICAEPDDEEIPVLKRSGLSIGFDLKDESYKTAEEVAAFLNRHIKNIVIF